MPDNQNLNIEFELIILSSYIYTPTLFEKTKLKEDDLYLQTNKEIFKSIKILFSKNIPIEESFILKDLQKRQVKNIELYEDAIINILTKTPIQNISHYEKEVKELSKKRKIQYEINKLNTLLQSQTPEESISSINILQKKILEDTETELFKISNSQTVEEKIPDFYLLDFLPIQKNEITIISAKGGTGKSFLGILLLALLRQKENLKVFGYFSEDDIGVVKYRHNILKKTHKEIPNIDYIGKNVRPKQFIEYDRQGNLHATEYFYEFKRQLKLYDIVLIDPLIAFIAKDENSNVEARFFMNLINEWCEEEDKTFLFLHHHSKGDNGGARGAGGFIDAVRLHYTINFCEEKENESEEQKKYNQSFRLLQLHKANHYSGKKEFKIQLFENKNIYNTYKTTTYTPDELAKSELKYNFPPI